LAEGTGGYGCRKRSGDMNQESYYISILERSIKEGLVVSVYSNQYELEKCSVGYIETLSSEQFVMKHITPEGISDGYIVRRLDDIFRIDFLDLAVMKELYDIAIRVKLNRTKTPVIMELYPR
jgi:hypothetical protein